MFSVFKKEVHAFFSSLIGYLAIGCFLVVLSLFLWVFPAYNVMNFGYATLDALFSISPMILMVLIPAITMRSFAEETKEGTIELLATRPLSDMDIIMGKYLAALFLVFFAILPTLVYYYSVYSLGTPVGNIDNGATIGSYIGLMLLGAAFVSIGIFVSAITNDQIVSFLIALALGALFYLGFYYMSSLPIFFGKSDEFVASLGMSYHFDALGRGLIDSRDVLYFVSIIVAFILLTKTALERRKW